MKVFIIIVPLSKGLWFVQNGRKSSGFQRNPLGHLQRQGWALSWPNISREKSYPISQFPLKVISWKVRILCRGFMHNTALQTSLAGLSK